MDRMKQITTKPSIMDRIAVKLPIMDEVQEVDRILAIYNGQNSYWHSRIMDIAIPVHYRWAIYATLLN